MAKSTRLDTSKVVQLSSLSVASQVDVKWVGDQLRRGRLRKGLRSVAGAAEAAGVSYRTLERIEKAPAGYTPGAESVISLARCFDVPPKPLLRRLGYPADLADLTPEVQNPSDVLELILARLDGLQKDIDRLRRRLPLEDSDEDNPVQKRARS